jgi:GLPGLI family protein
MFKFLLFIILIHSDFSFAQSALKIEYKQSYLGEPDKVTSYDQNGNEFLTNEIINLPKVRMLVNDSMAHIHYLIKGFDPLKRKNKEFGEKLVHHGYYLDFINLNYYNESSIDDLPEYLVIDTCTEIQVWKIFPKEIKVVLGYNCTTAIAVNKKNDTTLVFFTNELKYKRGFLFYEGIPGVVLEAFDQRYGGGRHYEAVKIDEIELKLNAPICKTIISCKDYREIIKKRNERLKGNFFKKKSTTRISIY